MTDSPFPFSSNQIIGEIVKNMKISLIFALGAHIIHAHIDMRDETVNAVYNTTVGFLLAQGQSDTSLTYQSYQPTSPLSLATQPQPFEISLKKPNHGLTRLVTRCFSNM